ncbi:MAG: putative metal-binding motif-containing protein [Planctomycetota bacterium]
MKVLALVLMTTLAACGGVEADVKGGGDAVSGDSYVSPTGCAGGASRLVLFQDADNDGYGNANGTTSTRCPEDAMPPGFASVDGDCNDSNGAIHTGCGTTNPPPSGNVPVDADGDNYWTIQSGPPDCNDQDKEINPGLTEVCGDGKDNDCNTSTSDACTVNPPPPSSGAKVKVTATYQTNIARELTAAIVDNTDFMGPYWHAPNVSFTTSGIKEIPVNVDGSGAAISPCGAVVNVNEPGNWLCYGHEASAHLDQAATTLVQYDGHNYTKDQCTTYSPPGGNDKGCAMWCSFKNPAARCHGK